MKWEYHSLQNIIEKPISGEWGDGEGETNVIRTTNFTNDGSLDLSDVVQRNIPLKKIEQKKLEFGDTIIEKSGGSPNQPVGRVVYFDQKDTTFLCNNFTSVIRAKSEVDKRYLFWFLFSNHLNQNTLRYQNKTTGIINLQLERYITDLQIPLPPLATQKRIAAILDAADALRRKDQALLQKYDELAQAIFVEMFGDPVKNEKGWEEIEIVNSCVKKDDIRCGPFGTQLLHSEFVTSGIPLWGIRHVNSGFKRQTHEFLTKEKANELDNYSILKGDIVMTRKGTIGNCAVYEFEEPGVMHSDLLRIRVNEQVFNPFFLSFQLKHSKKIFHQIESISQGAIMAGINVSKLKGLKVLNPPIDCQNKFHDALVTLRKSINCIEHMKSETLFQSLLQKAFNAELVP